MGEAKRRKRIETDYGQPKMPLGFADLKNEFVGKQVDFRIKRGFSGGIEVNCEVQPISPADNFARRYFNLRQDHLLSYILPGLSHEGKGVLVIDFTISQEDIGFDTQVIYFRSWAEGYAALQKIYCPGLVGDISSQLLKVASSQFCLEEDTRLIPLLGCQRELNQYFVFCV